ncbi:MAG: NUDIX domain-containing protein [Archaeoglobaceae archaeon]
MREEEILDSVKELSKNLPRFPDGRIDYSRSHIAPVITVFVKFGAQLLLLRRSHKVGSYQGKWNTVAGFVDEVKPVKDKVLEELEEEIGVEESDISSITYGELWKFEDPDVGKTWLITPVMVELKQIPEVKLDWEHTEFKWIKPSELNHFDTVPNLDKSWEKVNEVYEG